MTHRGQVRISFSIFGPKIIQVRIRFSIFAQQKGQIRIRVSIFGPKIFYVMISFSIFASKFGQDRIRVSKFGPNMGQVRIRISIFGRCTPLQQDVDVHACVRMHIFFGRIFFSSNGCVFILEHIFFSQMYVFFNTYISLQVRECTHTSAFISLRLHVFLGSKFQYETNTIKDLPYLTNSYIARLTGYYIHSFLYSY